MDHGSAAHVNKSLGAGEREGTKKPARRMRNGATSERLRTKREDENKHRLALTHPPPLYCGSRYGTRRLRCVVTA